MKNNKFLEFLVSKTGKAVITLVGMVLIYGLLVLCLSVESTAILGATLLVCAFFGWKALNKITPNIFLIMSVSKWVMYYFIKGLLSIFVGAFVAPFQIAKMITEKIQQSLN